MNREYSNFPVCFVRWFSLLLIIILISIFMSSCETSVEKLASTYETGNSDVKDKTILKLIKKLSSKELSVRISAAETLGKLQDPRAVEPLISSLDNEDDTNFSIEVIKTLGLLKDPMATERLIKYLEDNNNLELQKVIAESLGKIGITAKNQLIVLLNDKNPILRKNSAYALGIIRDPIAIEHVIPLLCDKNPDVVKNARNVLVRFGVLAEDLLIAALKDNNKDIRINSAYTLGEIGNSKSVKPLISAIKNAKGLDSWEFDWAYCDALSMIKDPSASGYLIDALKENDPRIRENAITSLGNIGSKDAVPHLIYALKNDNDPGIERESIVALGKIGDDKAVDPLLSILNTEYKSHRTEAAVSLCQIGNKKAIGSIIKYFSSRPDYDKEEISNAMVNFGSAISEPLVTLLNERDFYTRIFAIKVLETIKWEPQNDYQKALLYIKNHQWVECEKIGAVAVEPLVGAIAEDYKSNLPFSFPGYNLPDLPDGTQLKGTDPKWTGAKETLIRIDTFAVEPLLELLNSDDSYYQEIAAEVLGSIKDVRAVQPLITSLKSGDWLFKRNAIRALGELNDSSAVLPLIKLLEEKAGTFLKSDDEIIISLGKLGDSRGLEPIMKVLKDDNFGYLREEAVAAFEIYGDPRAIPELVNSLAHWKAGPNAAKTLKKLGWNPGSINDTVHLLVAQRSGTKLKVIENKTRIVLLADITSKYSYKMENALFAFVALGNDEVIPDLKKILTSKGDQYMAEVFLNSGNSALYDAAKIWAYEHGYDVKSSNSRPTVRWSEW